MVTQWGDVTSPKSLGESLEPRVLSGTTDIDDSAQTETTAFVLLTIAPASGESPARNVKVVLDLDKATTGWGTVESTATINFQIGRKVDGTNFRLSQAVLGTALTGTLAGADRSVEIEVGPVTEEVRIYAVTSADVTSDIEVPFQVIYEGSREPVVTAVAA